MSRPVELDDPTWLREAAAGRSQRSIAAELGCSQSAVQAAMRRHGIRSRPSRRASRPVVLDDRDWVVRRYAEASAGTIAAELGCARSTVISALRRHGIEVRDRSTGQLLDSHPRLLDAGWLTARYEQGCSGAMIAAELGVPEPTVYKALHRHRVAVDAAWVRRDTTRLERPSDSELLRSWEEDPRVRAIATRWDVAHTTAAVWLAHAGIFVRDTPALSEQQLRAAIDEGLPLRGIARRHRVGQHTVTIELIRHGLVEQHRHRPAPP